MLIKAYQAIVRPILPPSCRFYPSCSEYSLEALKTHGMLKGMKLTIFRLLRCHPWSKSGYDPVLPKKEKP